MTSRGKKTRVVGASENTTGDGQAPTRPGRRERHVTTTEEGGSKRLDSAVLELIVVASRRQSARCLRLPERQVVVFRPAGGVREESEGEILRVSPWKEWRYGRTTYIHGKVTEAYIDGAVLAPVPLNLYKRGLWDPDEEFSELWREDNACGRPDLPGWVQAVLDAGMRPEYEMEQVIPGADPLDLEDPIILAVECARSGDGNVAFDLLQGCLEGDLRCIDAYAHLGNLWAGDMRARWCVEQASKRYQAGVAVGEQSLPPGFNGLLPWDWVDNRPFLRALHGSGLCQWRLGDLSAARGTFMRLLLLDPNDSLGVRFLLAALEAGVDYLSYADR